MRVFRIEPPKIAEQGALAVFARPRLHDDFARRRRKGFRPIGAGLQLAPNALYVLD